MLSDQTDPRANLSISSCCFVAWRGSSYQLFSNTYLDDGGDLAIESMTSLADAGARCNSLSGCLGFTFMAGAWPRNVWFKNHTIRGTSPEWTTYIKKFVLSANQATAHGAVCNSLFACSLDINQQTCRLLPMYSDTNACIDYDWSDADGDTCSVYERLQWCTPQGGYGPGWDLELNGPFSRWATGGVDATKACCACGGGTGGGGRGGGCPFNYSQYYERLYPGSYVNVCKENSPCSNASSLDCLNTVWTACNNYIDPGCTNPEVYQVLQRNDRNGTWCPKGFRLDNACRPRYNESLIDMCRSYSNAGECERVNGCLWSRCIPTTCSTFSVGNSFDGLNASVATGNGQMCNSIPACFLDNQDKTNCRTRCYYYCDKNTPQSQCGPCNSGDLVRPPQLHGTTACLDGLQQLHRPGLHQSCDVITIVIKTRHRVNVDPATPANVCKENSPCSNASSLDCLNTVWTACNNYIDPGCTNPVVYQVLQRNDRNGTCAHSQPATQSPIGGGVEWMPMSSDMQS
eukprot:g38607.t1